jgi:hypothetical protein
MGMWRSIAKLVFVGAFWQSTWGALGGLLFLRRLGFLTVAAVVIIMLWAYSVPLTIGGYIYSLRVLCPALPIASVLAAVIVEAYILSSRWLRTAGWAALVLVWLSGFVSTALYPDSILSAKTWRTVYARIPEQNAWYDTLPDVVPRGARVLADSSYVHARLMGKGIDFVAIWSPEVEFLMDPKISPVEARKRLLKAGIRWVVFQPVMHGRFLEAKIPFYRDDRKNWLLRLPDGRGCGLYELPEPQPSN